MDRPEIGKARASGRPPILARPSDKLHRMPSIRTLSAALLLLPLLSPGQDDKLKLKVRISQDEQANDNRRPQVIIPVQNNNILVCRVRDEGAGVWKVDRMAPRFELYDRAKLNVVRGQEPSLKVKQGPLFLEDLVWFGNEPRMIAARRDTIAGRVEVYWQRLDPTLTRHHPPFDPLVSFDAKVTGTGKRIPDGQAHRDPLFTTVSANNQWLLVHGPAIEGTDGRRRHVFAVVDKTMTPQWTRVMDLPGDARYQDVQLDDDGNAYLLMRRVSPASGKDTSTHHIELSRVNGDGVEVLDTGLGKERRIKSAKLHRSPKGELMLSGIHAGLTPKGDLTHTNFIGRVGGDKLDIAHSWRLELEPEDMTIPKGIRMLDILPRGDGGWYVINEYHQETSAPDNKRALSGLRWVHGPLMVFSVDANGHETWSSVFRRLHITWDPQVGEPFPLVHKGQLLIFMLDSEPLAAKRKAKSREQSHTDMKQPYSVYAEFMKDGSERTRPVLRTGGTNDIIQGTRLWNVAPGEYYVLGAWKPGASRLTPVQIQLLD